MTDRLHLQPRHRRALEALLREHLPDVEVWAYGSRVNGKSHDGSDLDLVLRGPGLKEIPLGRLADFEEAVQESRIPFLVEARDWARLPERFHREIERQYSVLVEGSGQHANGEWRTVSVGDCIEINSSAYNPKEEWIFVNYLDTGNITENRIGEIQHLIFGKDKIPSRARRRVKPGEIVYSTVRPNQRHYGLLKDVPENFLASTGFAVIRGRKDISCTEFIYWFLVQDHIVETLHTLAEHSTSAYPSIRPASIEELTLQLPPLPEQRSIARVLSTLDDKIELNRRMNETLEATAQAIFKDWFVDFGPVRAKMEGREPYLSPELWNLFPDALDDEGKPVGWRMGILSTVADSPKRAVHPSDAVENTPYIGLEHMPRRSIALSEWETASKVKSGKLAFKCGEFLFGRLRPYFHKVGVAPLDGICSTSIAVVSPKASCWAAFTLACLSSNEFVNYTTQTSTGTTMPWTSWKTMGQYETCLPSEETGAAFQSLVQPLLEKIVGNVHEAHSLAKTRDLLLPKLVSGEINLRAAERAVEAGTANLPGCGDLP